MYTVTVYPPDRPLQGSLVPGNRCGTLVPRGARRIATFLSAALLNAQSVHDKFQSGDMAMPVEMRRSYQRLGMVWPK